MQMFPRIYRTFEHKAKLGVWFFSSAHLLSPNFGAIQWVIRCKRRCTSSQIESIGRLPFDVWARCPTFSSLAWRDQTPRHIPHTVQYCTTKTALGRLASWTSQSAAEKACFALAKKDASGCTVSRFYAAFVQPANHLRARRQIRPLVRRMPNRLDLDLDRKILPQGRVCLIFNINTITIIIQLFVQR
jgi:hypothetical protein